MTSTTSLSSLANRGFRLVLVLVGAFSLVASAAAQKLRPAQAEAAFDALAAKAAQGEPVRIIVQFEVGFVPEGLQTDLQEVRQQRESIQEIQTAVVARLAAPTDVIRFRFIPALGLTVDAADLARLRADPQVVSVQEDEAVSAHDGTPVSPLFVDAARLDESTALVGAQAAWAAGFDGTGFEVAILDTGVDSSHPFLAGKVVAEACFSTTASSGGFTSATVCPNGASSQTGAGAGANCNSALYSDGCFHGTHVAGIAAGRNASPATPVAGVARGAGVVAVQVFSGFTAGCSSGGTCVISYTSDQLRGLEHVYGLVVNGGRRIVAANMSLGGGQFFATCDSDVRKAAIDNLLSAGVATVISSGNNGFQNSTGGPGCISSAVTVGSTTKTDGVSGFSNVAPWMDLFAPGSSIRSSIPGGAYSNFNGTSMSAPHVAGAFAVLRQRFPAETIAQLLERLRTSGVGILAGSPVASYPRIQIDAAMLPPAQASIASGAISRMAGPGATAVASVAVSNTAAPGSRSLTYSAALQNQTFVPLARPAPPTQTEPTASRPTGTTVVRGVVLKGQPSESPALASRPAFGAGGLDAFGYRWDDSNEPGGPVYAFTDISATGTAVVLGGDAASPAIPLPFSFSFYGTAYTSLFIGSNGILGFQSGTIEPNNFPIPTFGGPSAFLAPYWDDLAPNLGGTIRYQTVGTDFVVQFTNVPRFPTGSGSVSFQVVLKPSGEIRFQYQAAPTTSPSATIGIENQTGTVGLQVVFNAPYAAPNLAVRFRAGRTWLTASGTTGALAPGASGAVGLAFDGTGLTEGTYTADLVVTTNDPVRPTTAVPVAFTVGGTGVVAGGPGWRMLAAPAAGVTVADLAAMNLVQGVPGYYPTGGSNLLTGYTGSGYTPIAGGSTVLAPGRGFWWYFYGIEGTPGGPSTSHALPTTLATTNPAVTADVPVGLHASGTRFNLLGNPFGTSMSLANVASWSGAGTLASTVAQVWDASTASYDVSVVLPTVAPWQGFWVEASTAGTLTIPAGARTTGGVLQRDAPVPTLGFTLAQTDPGSGPGAGSPLQDRAAVLTFPDGATDGADVFDAAKLAPFAGTYVMAALGADGGRAVESLPAPTSAAVAVPLHVSSVGAGERLVLTWPHAVALSETWTLTLTDLATGAVVDLRTATEYAFTVTAEAARDPLAVPEATAAPLTGTPARFVVTVGPRGATATEGGAAAVFALDAPAPNPARGTVALAYSLAEAGAARVSVVDLLGREVAVVAEGEQAAGRHVASVDVSGLAPGVYVVRLASGGEALARRVVVVR